MTKKKAFMVYIDNETQVNLLDDAAAGKLFKALFRFARGEDVGFEDGMLQMICSFMTAQMARDLENTRKSVGNAARADDAAGKQMLAKEANVSKSNKIVIVLVIVKVIQKQKQKQIMIQCVIVTHSLPAASQHTHSRQHSGFGRRWHWRNRWGTAGMKRRQHPLWNSTAGGGGRMTGHSQQNAGRHSGFSTGICSARSGRNSRNRSRRTNIWR